MSLFTQEKMRALIDALSDGKSMRVATALAYGSKSKIGWVHIRNAKHDRENGVPMDESKYVLKDWPEEGEHHWLDHAYTMAQQIAKMDFHLETLEEIRQSTRPVIEGGRVQYEVDEKLIADYKDAEEAEAFGVHDWPYKHNEKGERLVLRTRDRVGNMLTLAALKAVAGDTWNTETKVSVDTRKNRGVLVLGTQKALSQRQPSPLVDDMQSRLAALRANGPSNPKPNAPVEIFGRGDGGPAENVSNTMADDVKPDLRDHPRAYEQPAPQPKPPQPAVDYRRRPTKNLNAEDRPVTGPMPSGGVSVTTGRHT